MKTAFVIILAALIGGLITYLVLHFLGPELNPWPATVVVAVMTGLLSSFRARR